MRKRYGYYFSNVHIALMMRNFNLEQVSALASRFDIEGNVTDVSPFGSGHINDTYRVLTDGYNTDGYLLQRVNHHVFKNVKAVMENMQLVIRHLKEKYRQAGDQTVPVEKKVLTLIPTRENDPYLVDDAGNFWRMLILLADTRSYDIVETPQQAREGGRAFGQFQRLLSDLDVGNIHEVLPDFHHIGKRLDKLNHAVAADPVNRVAQASAELAAIKCRERRMHTILDLAADGILPIRITHNDTKFNNVLLDMHDKAQCVIDLDTVMPGYVAYDFGDAIRTIINRAAEDEADLSKITLNIPLFEAYVSGYFEEAHYFLTAEEVSSLIEGVLLLPYMQAVRFLTDFLEGDHYYKVHHADHNLQRTRAQLRLVEQLEVHEPELREIIDRVVRQYQK
ncbi:phosphotransferase enzyme family protein [Parapedobacter defluvii]|uniref:phosphotransferase enzyme family protein n=1 Tax=Parapedobacter defluvii TaxID=2045106 RepID=UPI001E3F0FD4|nr:aminoglycoside phosphotransferase family protein [Parapedobacter defluvii]